MQELFIAKVWSFGKAEFPKHQSKKKYICTCIHIYDSLWQKTSHQSCDI